MSSRPMPETLEMLARLMAFDTTSRNSNLPLIDFAEAYLREAGARTERIVDESGTKANLWVSIGPEDVPGIVLSGHTDTVPVDGQDWTSDPFILTERDGLFYGRGSCDMKGFVAVALAMVPRMVEAGLKRPIHLALSYDEEVGCLGVRRMLEALAHRPLKPAGCIVGEPTLMAIAIGHKTKRSLRAVVRGTAGHSSRAPEFVNAVEHGARIVVKMREIAQRLEREGGRDDLYDIAHSTAHVGMSHGGIALNIVPDRCEIVFEFRVLPEEDADALVAEITEFVRVEVEPEMQARDAGTGVRIELTAAFPGLSTDADHAMTTLAKRLAGRNDHIKVAYGTEAGLFDEMGGIPTIICGPGSIGQAHKPDEFVSGEQLAACEAFIARLIEDSR